MLTGSSKPEVRRPRRRTGGCAPSPSRLCSSTSHSHSRCVMPCASSMTRTRNRPPPRRKLCPAFDQHVLAVERVARCLAGGAGWRAAGGSGSARPRRRRQIGVGSRRPWGRGRRSVATTATAASGPRRWTCRSARGPKMVAPSTGRRSSAAHCVHHVETEMAGEERVVARDHRVVPGRCPRPAGWTKRPPSLGHQVSHLHGRQRTSRLRRHAGWIVRSFAVRCRRRRHRLACQRLGMLLQHPSGFQVGRVGRQLLVLRALGIADELLPRRHCPVRCSMRRFSKRADGLAHVQRVRRPVPGRRGARTTPRNSPRSFDTLAAGVVPRPPVAATAACRGDPCAG